MALYTAIITIIFIISSQSADGQKIFNVTSEICCDGTIHPEPGHSNGYRCCGSTLLSTAEGQCCGADVIVPYPPGTTDHFFNWGCCHSQKNNNITLFNFRSQLCCKGVVHDVGSNFSRGCCGELTFDSKTSMCCDDVIHEIDHRGELGCCGSKMFNFSSEICCSNWPNVTLEAIVNDTVNDNIQFQLKSIPMEIEEEQFNYGCCGLDIFNYKKELCCDGVRVPVADGIETTACCGKKVIKDWTKETCCEGEVMSKDNPDQWCCGKKLYNIEKEICCGIKIFPRSDDVGCCWEAEELYHPETQICCGNKIIDNNSTVGACCIKRDKRRFFTHRPVG
ncbi:hypothetical protein CHUAL_006259 [Chamberlinius hualienensis]